MPDWRTSARESRHFLRRAVTIDEFEDFFTGSRCSIRERSWCPNDDATSPV
jgi:hypothetical protein